MKLESRKRLSELAAASGAQLRLVRRMTARRILTIVLVGIGVVGIAGIAAELSLNPLRRSDSEIRKWVLQKTPIGSTREQVMAVIAREHWEGHPEFRGSDEPGLFKRGVSFYGADLGSYQGFPFRCRSNAFWCFGPDDKVTYVYVSSWCEGI